MKNAMILLIFTSIGVLGSDSPCQKPCQKALIQSYFESLTTVYRAGSSEKDLERLFELFHDDVKYEHLDYQANFTKTSWWEAFLRNYKRGAYQAKQNESLGVLKMIHGKNHVAVEYADGHVDEQGKWKAKEEGRLILFGFKEGKISLVREYW